MKCWRIGLITLAFAPCIGANANAATVLRVRADAPGPTHDGSSWNDAFLDLNSAIAAATAGDQIWVPEGIYYPTGANPSSPSTSDQERSFALKSGVTLYGGFDDTTDTSLSDRFGSPAEITFLSGDLGDSPTDNEPDSNNSYHVVTADDVTGAVVDGFTIEAGYATNPSSGPLTGAGVLISGESSVSFFNCRIRRNWAFYGGGVYVEPPESGTSEAAFADCEFNRNWAKLAGGGIYNDAAVEFDRCRFVDNGTEGIGAFTETGGAIFSVGSTGRKLRVRDSLFYGNSAIDAGGAFHVGGDVELRNVTATMNQARDGSAAPYTYNDGGGLYVAGVTATIVRNSIFWENNDGATSPLLDYQIEGAATVTHSCVQDDAVDATDPFGGSANGNIDDDPSFIGAGSHPYAISVSSPAVDAGRTVLASALDVLRETRVVRCRVDMGAYEYQVETEEGGACCAGDVCYEVASQCACQTGYVCDINALNDGTAPYGSCGNNTGGCCYGDVDGNGVVNAGDRGPIGAALGTSDPNLICLNDLDGNGVVNAADKAFVTANIGLCTTLPDWQNGSGNNSYLNDGEYDPRFPGEFTLSGDCETTVCEE